MCLVGVAKEEVREEYTRLRNPSPVKGNPLAVPMGQTSKGKWVNRWDGNINTATQKQKLNVRKRLRFYQ